MSNYKRLIAGIGCRDQKAVLPDGTVCSRSLEDIAHGCNDNGADGLLIYDMSENDADHERTIGLIKETARGIDIPIITGGRVKRLEDVKKYLYAGAQAVYLDGGNEENVDLIKEASSRFGSEKIYVMVPDSAGLCRVPEFFQLGASTVIICGNARAVLDGSVKILGGSGAGVLNQMVSGLKGSGQAAWECGTPGMLTPADAEPEKTGYLVAGLAAGNGDSISRIAEYLKPEQALGAVLPIHGDGDCHYMEMKQELSALGYDVDILKSPVSWDGLKKNPDGLVPVIVQDFRTLEVLMLAYMNEQAFADTLSTGKMHYYSRSRKSQWLKGETSGHFQYVKSLHLDCDNDTLMAKVHQIGAACHTGARSCFYQTLAQKEYRETNPLKVFEDVFSVIMDRKEHPKEGSYTNYLFDKGIDKILKKVGEEATEIIIAAKNPDPEEIKYEISDFLYHVMVLMAERGVTWEEIMEELANR